MLRALESENPVLLEQVREVEKLLDYLEDGRAATLNLRVCFILTQ